MLKSNALPIERKRAGRKSCFEVIRHKVACHSLKSPAGSCVSITFASVTVNANRSIVRAIAKLRVVNCVADCVWISVTQPTEWQRIGNQIDAAMIFAGAHFVSVYSLRSLDEVIALV
jgi:hypothetical protein